MTNTTQDKLGNFTIRLANDADFSQLERVLATTHPMFISAVESPIKQHVILALEAEKIYGLVKLASVNSAVAQLASIYILPDVRATGLTKLLLQQAYKFAKDLGYASCQILSPDNHLAEMAALIGFECPEHTI